MGAVVSIRYPVNVKLPPMIQAPSPGVNLRVSMDLWPLVHVTVSKELRYEDVDYLHRICDQVFTSAERHAFLVDCSRVHAAPGADVRRKIKLYEDSRHELSAKHGICCAIVFQNALVRGAYTALRWVSEQPVPNRAFSTVEDAARWCIEAMEREEAPVPVAAYALAGMQVKAV